MAAVNLRLLLATLVIKWLQKISNQKENQILDP